MRSMLTQGEYSYLEGQCLHYGEAMAYLPIVNALRAYFDIEEGELQLLSQKKLKQRLTQLDERLLAMLPPLQELLSLKVEDDEFLKLEPQQKRVRIFEAIWSLIIRESRNRLLILAVEDLQWLDKASEEFLSYLIGRLGGAHVLLLLLYRPEFNHSWGSKTYYSQIRVDELTLETSAEMVQAILKGVKAAQDLTKLILYKAAGNPLFMEEFTRTLLEKGYIERKNGCYVLTVKPSDIQVPETVQGIIAARMDRLEKDLKETMQIASVIGREFPFPILQNVTGMREKLEAYLLELQALEFIYERSMFPELEYIFKHALTQQVAYSSLLLKKRKEVHESIGRAIETLYPNRLDEFYEALAFHFKNGSSTDKAIYYLTKAAEKSFDRYAVEESHRHYIEAYELLYPRVGEVKGAEVQLIDLLMRLEVQANKAGGRVHVLLGNHEVMNIRGDLRYVSAGEYDSYKSPGAEALQHKLFESDTTTEQRKDGDYRRTWEKQHPLGWVERWIAFSEAGVYGKWLRRRNTVIRINGVLFLHGGISPKYASLDIRDINERVRAELLKPPAEARIDVVVDPEGPLWYRGLAQSPEPDLAGHVDNVLAAFRVQHLVIAHTPTPGIVMPRFGGKVIMIDVGLSEAFGAGQACLEFEGGKPSAIHRGKALELPMDTDLAAYLKAAEDLEPPNSLLRRYMDRLTKSTGQ